MTDSSALVPSSELLPVFDALVSPGESMGFEHSMSGTAALALAVSYGVGDPNREVLDETKVPRPLLSTVLHTLQKERRVFASPRPGVPKVDVSTDATVSLPLDATHLPARERLALFLIRSGADPWVKDADGLDALDWSIRAQARSVFAALLNHPGCPAKQELRNRTTNHVGREIPWLHALAYFDAMEMFDDLIALGWDRAQKDRNGWPASAWVNTPQMLQAILTKQSEEQNSAQRPVVEKALARRISLGLTSVGFNKAKINEALAQHARLDEKDALNVQLTKLMEGWLSANPAHETYHYKGLAWRRTNPSNPSKDMLIEHFDWRFTQKSGLAKGSWSMLGASIWGVSRGEREGAALSFLAERLMEVLQALPQSRRHQWLKDEIRPGMTNQGLAWVALGSRIDAAQHTLFSTTDDPDAAKRERVEAAVSTLESVWAKSMSTKSLQWALNHASSLWLRENLTSSSEAWAWRCVSTLAKKGFWLPTLGQYRNASRNLRAALERSGKENEQVFFDAALELLGAGISFQSTFNRDMREREQKEGDAARVELWKTVEEVMTNRPALVTHLNPDAYPFETFTRGSMAKGLPDVERWSSLVLQGKLEASIDSTAPRSIPRPRM